MRFLERPPEAAALLNPGFVALLLSHAAFEYHQYSDTHMPWPLAFLVPPLVLHEPTRTALPRSVSTSVSAWVQREPSLRAGIPDRAKMLTPIVLEALRFGLRGGALYLQGPALLAAGTPRRPPQSSTHEVRECVARARLVGRWFSAVRDPATVMLSFGVRP